MSLEFLIPISRKEAKCNEDYLQIIPRNSEGKTWKRNPNCPLEIKRLEYSYRMKKERGEEQ